MTFNKKSLKNLHPNWTTESAREAQKKGVATRNANKEAREAAKMSMAEWKLYKTDVLDSNDMIKAVAKDDLDTALEIAKTLAEFEAPKLARIDQTNVELSAEDLSDEELQELLDEAASGNAEQMH